jgi:DNA invertase Pin-like site-specific DNA recombinase
MRRGQPKVAIYTRVSTTGQDPAMQLSELRKYCRNRSWIVEHEYTDKGISGSKDSRPELDRLISDAHKRRFDVVVVWKFDRFARSVSHLLRSLELFGSLGIEFVSLSEQIDTGTPAGKLVFTVLGAVAELERSLIAERVRSGLRNARAKGKRLGRAPLRTFSDQEIRELRKRRSHGVSFKKLAIMYGTSVFTAFQLCKSKHFKSVILK